MPPGAHGLQGGSMSNGQDILQYRRLVNKRLTFFHSEIEAGLRRADEQEQFIYQVWHQLMRLNWPIRLAMDNSFNVIFHICHSHIPVDQQKMHVKAVLATMADVFAEGKRLHASSKAQDYLSCAIAFGEMEL